MISKFLHKKESWCSRIEILKNIWIIWWLLVQLNQRLRYTKNIFKSPNQFGAVVYCYEEPQTGFSSKDKLEWFWFLFQVWMELKSSSKSSSGLFPTTGTGTKEWL
jgi:hypothetical protein